ncbi:MAG: hypothetical protein ACFFCQ_17340 [Promethearchaeota archaeon]
MNTKVEWDRYNIIYSLLGIFFLYTIMRQLLRPFSIQDYDILSDVDTFLIGLCTGYVFVLVALKFDLETTSGKIWALLGIGTILWALGDMIYAIYEISYYLFDFLEEDPFPSIADIPWVLAYLFLFTGLYWEYRILEIKVKMRDLFLFLIIIFLLTLAAAVLLLIEVATYTEESIPVIDRFLYLYYPIADIILLFFAGLIFLKFIGGKIAWPWFIIVIAFIITGVGDFWYNYLEWIEEYGSYSIADLPYYLGYIVQMIGGLEMCKLLSKKD